MAAFIPMQTMNTSSLDQGKPCSFDLEVINEPTTPLIHPCARFLLVNKGRGKIKIQNTCHDLVPGALVAILPWQISDVVEVQEALQYFLVVYRFDIVQQVVNSFYSPESQVSGLSGGMARAPVAYCSGSQMELVHSIFLTIRDEVGIESTAEPAGPKLMGGVYVTNALIQLTVLFLRVQGGRTLGAHSLQIDRTEILQYMYNHLSEKLTLKMLSQIFYMSESSISQYITKMMGLSFFDLLNEMRVGKTINFLLYTDFTLEELAEILGYVDASHISKVFSARMGMRANEYRQTYQRVGHVCRIKESRKAYSIVAYLYRNHSEALSAQTVAKKFAVSVQELHRMLLYQVERNFEDYLNYLRVNRACELLLSTDKTVIDIAMEVGYHSAKTLTRNFVKLRFMTPGEFRKRVSSPQENSGPCISQ